MKKQHAEMTVKVISVSAASCNYMAVEALICVFVQQRNEVSLWKATCIKNLKQQLTISE